MLWNSITLSTLTRDVIFPSVSNKQGGSVKRIWPLIKTLRCGRAMVRKMRGRWSCWLQQARTHTLWPAAHWSVDTVEDMKPNPSVAQWPWKVVEKIPLNVPLNMVFYNRICPCVCQWRQLFHFFRLLQWILSCVGELNMWMMHQVFIASMTSNDFTIYLLWKQ